MSQIRIGRPPTHGVRSVARILGVVKVNGAPVRLDKRTKRARDRLQQQLEAAPIETVRSLLIENISNGHILGQMADAILLTSPDLRNETGLAKFVGWINNRTRRASELLVLLERGAAGDQAGDVCPKCAGRFALSDYVKHPCVTVAVAVSDEGGGN